MCVLCDLKKQDSTAALKSIWKGFYQGVVESASTLDNAKGLRDYYVKLLRDSADQIEANALQEESLKVTIGEMRAEFDAKLKKVDEYLQGKDAEFYQTYGVAMPKDIRASLKQMFWDSLEREVTDVGTEQAASEHAEQHGGGQPLPDHSEEASDGGRSKEGGEVRHAEQGS